MRFSLFKIRRYVASSNVLFAQPAILVWAIILGVAGALTTIAFYQCLKFLQLLHSHQFGDVIRVAEQWSVLQKLMMPTLGGLLGALALVLAARIKVDANSDYMEAVAIGNGRLSIRQGLLRVFSSLSVASVGWSLGREGPIIHLAAMNGSILGRFFKLEPNHFRLLVACGASAGVSAAYYAPIAGALFVAEIVLGSMASHILGPLMLSSASAYITMHSLGFSSWLYEVPSIDVAGQKYVLFTLVLGIVSGIFAPLFLKYLDSCRRLFSSLHISLFGAMALSGLLLGCIFLIQPWVAGKGDTIIHSFLTYPWTLQSVFILLLFKLVSTGLSVGSGAVGGVITPVMLVGASMAMLLTKLCALVMPELASFTPLFVLVGMGAFLGAATSAPLVATVLVVEMSHSFNVISPLMLATVVSFFVARMMTNVVMFKVTEQREQSDDIRHKLSKLNIKSLLNRTDTVITPNNTLQELVTMFSEHGVRYIYVVNEYNEFLGAIANKDITRMLLAHQDLEQTIPADFIERSYLEPLNIHMSLDEVQERFVDFVGERLPVVDTQTAPHLLGIVYKSDVLRKLSEIKKIVDKSPQTVVDIRG